jgi:HEAT repeat protein
MAVRMSRADRIESLIVDLSRNRGDVHRRRVRESLVAIGGPAVNSLVGALANPNPHVRWDAITALKEIGGPEVAPALVRTLAQDPDGGIRWLAAEGLINMRLEGLRPLLQMLAQDSSSGWLKEGARYVIRSMATKEPNLNGHVKAVLAALEDPKHAMPVSQAAQATLDSLNGETVAEPAQVP